MKNKKYYLAMINLNGLITKSPILCYRQDDFNENYFWDKSGNFDVDISKPKFQKNVGHIIKYWSDNKKDVQLFIMGARSVTTTLKNLTYASY